MASAQVLTLLACVAFTVAQEQDRQMKDISGIALAMQNASFPIEDLVTAGQPEEQHFEQLTKAGFKTVVDIHTPEEPRDNFDEQQVVRRAGMGYINISVGHEAVDDETLDQLRELLRDPIPA